MVEIGDLIFLPEILIYYPTEAKTLPSIKNLERTVLPQSGHKNNIDAHSSNDCGKMICYGRRDVDVG